jgi:hypothetical protein
MGVYELYMGKGIIVPVRTFVKHFLKEINEIHKPSFEHETLQEIVKKYIGDYEICSIGHDAFKGRHGFISDMFENTPNESMIERIGDMISGKEKEDEEKEEKEEEEREEDEEEEEQKEDNLPFVSLGCGDLIFIGHFNNICPNELSYYIKAPEVIYSLAACIPLIVKYYPILLAKECKSLNIFEQEARIWTFATDCCCCG